MKAMSILLLSSLACMPIAATAALREYSATYEVEYKGRRVGESTFTVTAAEQDRYRFRSETRAKGLLRLASPKPVIDSSLFELRGDRIQPIEFAHEDGSRKGEDNFTIAFDWPVSATVQGENGAREIDLSPGVLDRGSLQVQLMLDADGSVPITTFDVIDDDGLDRYGYEELEQLEVATGAGPVATVRLRQHREGSSRSTIISMAPTWSYVPARIEQIRNGEVETVFTLQTIEFID